MKKNFILIIFFLLSISGFSQSYLGNITKQVNFREGPGSDYEIIKSLKPGSQIFISSLDTDDDFYNIVDIESDIEGYVHKSYVKIGKLISKSDGSFIQESGNSSSDDAEVRIINDSDRTMTIKLNSTTYKFNAKEKQNLILPPGDYSYRASAPNVIPSVGVKNFKFNGAYKWTFYIVTRRR
ncbi:MAG: SH3 domain-containing protein [Bacteroidia bacterium]|nr:SH3 domain-containing protein [Bacteroidia bacterium]